MERDLLPQYVDGRKQVSSSSHSKTYLSDNFYHTNLLRRQVMFHNSYSMTLRLTTTICWRHIQETHLNDITTWWAFLIAETRCFIKWFTAVVMQWPWSRRQWLKALSNRKYSWKWVSDYHNMSTAHSGNKFHQFHTPKATCRTRLITQTCCVVKWHSTIVI